MTSSKTDRPAATASGPANLTHDVIHEAVGEIGDAEIAAIIATGATLEQFDEAAALAVGESDVISATRIHPDPVIHAVYEIITATQPGDEDRP